MFVVFYLNVFYLPVLKQVVGQHKMWNDAMFWFSQMISYNAYISLLIRQANDVEENPGPTIFDVIDPTRTICADYSQGNEALFGENAGKQCVAMSLTAIIYHHIEDISLWTSSTLNNILTIGNNLYTSIRCSVQTNDYLLLTDVPCIVSIYNKVYTLEYSESLTGSLFMTSNNGPYMSLQNSLTEVFSNCQLNYNCCLLTIGINTVAVIKNSEQSFKIFDAHSRDLHGMPHSFGKCTLLTIEGIENLVSYLNICGHISCNSFTGTFLSWISVYSICSIAKIKFWSNCRIPCHPWHYVSLNTNRINHFWPVVKIGLFCCH